MIPISILDVAPIVTGGTPRDALDNSADLARHAERLGYHRFWVAEHHNMSGIGSAATAVYLAHIGAATQTIRIGSGGIMLPNHSPMVIAEQFGTLEWLHPGRVDLGLGRAPGTDGLTLRALRRDPQAAATFPQDVQELQALLAPVQDGQPVQAVPGGGTQIPLWILGSSTFGAQLAAALGLPYAFASHFSPDDLHPALEIYRSTFTPSAQLDRPYAMLGLNVFAADTDAEARRLFTTMQQGFTNIRRGEAGPFPAPIDDIDDHWSPSERSMVSHMLAYSIVGGPDAIREGLERFVEETGADELMVTSVIYDHAARVRSYEILAEVASQVTAAAGHRGPSPT